MIVYVYVEGQSDIQAMNALLKPVIEAKVQKGIWVRFIEQSKGDAKKAVLLKVPTKAAGILVNDPNAVVVAMPDLYPANKGFDHETKDELISGIIRNFEKALPKKALDDVRIKNRFKAFCFKHDLEVLLLAAEDQLKAHLGKKTLKPKWRKPVEDQDFDQPPKRIVEKLFEANHMRYSAPIDAPCILGTTDYKYIADRCPQCFKPFVDFLENLLAIS